MPIAAELISRIQRPFPAILDMLENLNRQRNFSTATLETTGDRFGTITASRRANKPFIVGFIPPDNVVNFIPVKPIQTSVILTGLAPSGPPSKTTSTRDYVVPAQVVQAAAGSGEKPTTQTKCSPTQMSAALTYAWQQLFNETPSKATVSLLLAQWAHETGRGKNCHNWNIGNIKFVEGDNRSRCYLPVWEIITDPKTGKKKRVQYDPKNEAEKPFCAFRAYPTVETGAIDYLASLRKKYAGAWPSVINGDPEAYAHDLKVLKYYTDDEEKYKASMKSLFNEYNGSSTPSSISDVATAATVMANDPNAALVDPLGRNPDEVLRQRRESVAKQTQALQRQIDVVRSIAPLLMLINPSEFTRSYEWNTDDSPTGRYGHIVHIWQEKPLIISSNGVSAGQYAIGADGSGGLTNFYRVHSLGYQNLMSLQGIYKNNGVLFTGSESDAGIPILAMSLFIYYDNRIYVGTFDDFSITDSADKPFNMQYSYKFTCRYDLELDGINENLDQVIINNLRF